MSASHNKNDPPVVYSPPASETLNAFAQEVCHNAGEPFTDQDFLNPFTLFIRNVAEINAGYFTRKNAGALDNDTE